MPETIKGWGTYVQRGPDWLFVRLADDNGHASPPSESLADSLWELLRCHFAQRMVLEMDEVSLINSALLGHLAVLAERIHECGGMLRLTGLTPAAAEVIARMRLEQLLPHYESREAAVMCHRPTQPR